MSTATGMAGQYHRGLGSDHHHKGTGQGGNKSMLSWRVDIGVPGYTGYIPSSASIPLPHKGSTEHTGKIAGASVSQRLAAATTKDTLPRSMYSEDMGTVGNNFKPPTKSGGGYWITNASRDGDPKTFVANTTYSAEVQNGASTATKVTGLTDKLRPTFPVSYNSLAAAGATESKAAPGVTEPLGYVSTYTSMVVKDPKTGGLVAAGSERPATVAGGGAAVLEANGRPRDKVLKRSQTAVFHGETLYMRNMGTYGSDPISRSAKSEAEITKSCTTAEFNEGTTRKTMQIPGYSGFIPASNQNGTALVQAECYNPRASLKDSMLLSALDQHARDQVPRYCGFRPQVANNIKPQQAPTTLTTSGKANFEVTSTPMKVLDNSNCRKSEVGTMSFFTPGQVSVSDNGQSNAELYYHCVRPREGLPRIFNPSKTTASGYTFQN